MCDASARVPSPVHRVTNVPSSIKPTVKEPKTAAVFEYHIKSVSYLETCVDLNHFL